MPKKYTLKTHKKNLIAMLKKGNPCMCCPAGKDYETGISLHRRDEVCEICTNFVGYSKTAANGPTSSCPCFYYDKKDAIRRTYEALDLPDPKEVKCL